MDILDDNDMGVSKLSAKAKVNYSFKQKQRW